MSNRDQVLIHRVLALGDTQAFEALVVQYQSPVRRFLRRLTDESQAEDLAQDTFIKAYQNLNRYSGKGRFLSWLFSIAYQQYAQYLRKLKPTESGEWEQTGKEHMASNLLFLQCLKACNPNEKAALTLSIQFGLTQEEISEALDKPLGTIKSYMTRGKQKMREIYQGGSHAKLR